MPLVGDPHRGIRVEHGDADGGTGRGAHPLGEEGAGALGVEVGEHQLGELVPGDPHQGLLLGDDALVDEVDGDAEGGLGGALADPGLQHPQVALLDGELDVAHVAVVALEARHDVEQLVVALLVDGLEVGQGERVADAGDDVLALGVLQVVAVDADRAGRRVTGEGDAGAGGGAAVAEGHRLHVDGGAEVGGDLLAAAVEDGAVGVPRVEDGQHRAAQLLARVLRERRPGLLLDHGLEGRDERPQVVGVEVDVGGDALGGLGGVDGVLEAVTVEVEHGLAVHLHQAAVGVPGEAGVAGLCGQALDRDVAEPDVEHRLHHPGHRELGARAHRHQQRVGAVAQRAAHPGLEQLEVLVDLREQLGRDAAAGQVGTAGIRGDGEARGHRDAEAGHLREVGTLAAQQVLLVHAAGLEVVDELGHQRPPPQVENYVV